MQNVVIDCERLALSPVLHDQDLSQVYLFLCAHAGRRRSTCFEMTAEQVASFVNIGPKIAADCLGWLASVDLVVIVEDTISLVGVSLVDREWIDHDRVGFEQGFNAVA